ncbi:MAG: urease accessory protein UreD [Pseudomonadota bacterium]
MSARITPVRLTRAEGEAHLALRQRGDQTVIDTLYQRGCAKIRFPRLDPGIALQAVTLNTAGGLTDGDDIEQRVHWGAGTRALVTTQAAERVYRSRGGDAHVRNVLTVEAGARAVWLPQETIVFDGGRLARAATITLAKDATLFAAETWTLGRTAMGEAVHTGALHDRWRIEQEGTLLWADALQMDSERDGDLVALTRRRAVLDGNIAMMTAVLVTPLPERYLQPARGALESCNVTAGVTHVGAVLVMRALATNAADLRHALLHLFDALRSVDAPQNPLVACEVPRVFDC